MGRWFRGWLRWICSVGLGLGVLPGEARAMCTAELEVALEQIAQQPLLASSRVGILLERLGDRQVIYQRDADRFFVPASNAKLFTSAAVLDQLGPDYRIRTSIHGQVQPDGLAALRVMGRGDPSLSTTGLEDLAAQVKAKGVRQVTHLIGDDRHFSGSAVNANWEWEDVQAGYGAPVNGLILNRNEVGLTLSPQAVGQPLAVTWENAALSDRWRIVNTSRTVSAGREFVRVGRDLAQPILYVSGQLIAGSAAETASIAEPRPAQAFVEQLAQIFQKAGVAVSRTSVVGQDVLPITAPLPELAARQSPPLADLLLPTNRDSENLYAEALLKTLGVVNNPEATDATEAGLEALEANLEKLGIASESIELVDASGIARQNLTTPRALVGVLQAMAAHPYAEPYRQSLAIAGVSGTLRYRLKNTALADNLRGKTGALTGNVTLSGYFTAPGYGPLVAAIAINHADERASRLRQVIDEVLLQMAKLQNCP